MNDIYIVIRGFKYYDDVTYRTRPLCATDVYTKAVKFIEDQLTDIYKHGDEELDSFGIKHIVTTWLGYNYYAIGSDSIRIIFRIQIVPKI